MPLVAVALLPFWHEPTIRHLLQLEPSPALPTLAQAQINFARAVNLGFSLAGCLTPCYAKA